MKLVEIEDRIIGGVVILVAEKRHELIVFGSVPRLSTDKLLALVATDEKPARMAKLTMWPNPDPEFYGWERGCKDVSSKSNGYESGGRYCAPWSTESD